MDYQRVYNQFIADRTANPPADGEYTEKHHILPRSLGGGDEAENILRLTAEDHYFAHMALAKIHGGSMWYAVTLMTSAPKYMPQLAGRDAIKKRSLYGYAKRHIAEITGEQMRKRYSDPLYAEHHRQITLNNWQDPSYREKQTERMKNAWQDPEYIEKMKVRPKPCPKNISEKGKAKWAEPGYRKKMLAIRKEKGKDPAFIEKMKAIAKEINSRPEVKAKQSASSNEMWASQERRDLQSRKIIENAYNKIRPVINSDLGIWFKNVHIAYDWLVDGNLKRPCKTRNYISDSCNHKTIKKTAGGYRWKYSSYSDDELAIIAEISSEQEAKRDAQRKKASNLAKKTRRPVINLDTGDIYQSVKAASMTFGIPKPGNISSCVRGKTKKAYGYRWAYVPTQLLLV